MKRVINQKVDFKIFDMFLYTYRYIYMICLVLFLLSCEKEEKTGERPTIRLVNENGLIANDTLISPGKLMHFGIEAESGDFPITLLSVKVITEETQTYFDSGMYTQQIIWFSEFVKSFNDNETWNFIVRDRYSQESSISILIKNDSILGPGPILTLNEIILGAQDNQSNGGFYSLDDQLSYSPVQAKENQELIDLIYYYFGEDENVIASPGANIEDEVFDISVHPSEWEIRNTSRYHPVDLTVQEFDTIQNDSILIASYIEEDGKRKAKNLSNGLIFSFKTQQSKFGILKVNEVSGTSEGTVNIDIKVQQ